MVRAIIISSICWLLLSINLVAQVNDLDPDAIVDSMAQEEVYNSRGVGIIGMRTNQWLRFDKLREFGSAEKLVQLCRHASPVVRCYAFEALVDRKDTATFKIVFEHLRDYNWVNTHRGCTISAELCGDFIVREFKSFRSDTTTQRKWIKVNAMLDSTMIADTTIILDAKLRALHEIRKRDHPYFALHKRVYFDNDPSAIPELISYRNPSDHNRLMTYLYSGDEKRRYYGLLALQRIMRASTFYEFESLLEEEKKRQVSSSKEYVDLLNKLYGYTKSLIEAEEKR